MEPSSKRVVSFGVFEADLDARELRKHGLRVKLHGRSLRRLRRAMAGVWKVALPRWSSPALRLVPDPRLNPGHQLHRHACFPLGGGNFRSDA